MGGGPGPRAQEKKTLGALGPGMSMRDKDTRNTAGRKGPEKEGPRKRRGPEKGGARKKEGPAKGGGPEKGGAQKRKGPEKEGPRKGGAQKRQFVFEGEAVYCQTASC